MVCAKLLSFHKHRGLNDTSIFIFMNIVGSFKMSLLFFFIFNNIVGSTFIIKFPLFSALGFSLPAKCLALNKIRFHGNPLNFVQVLVFSYTSWDKLRGFRVLGPGL